MNGSTPKATRAPISFAPMPNAFAATEVAVAVHALNCMLDQGRPSYVRIA